MPIGAIIGGVIGLAGAGISAAASGSASSAAKSAADAQVAAANRAADVQQNMFNTTQGNLKPWMTGGGNALVALQQALGLIPGTIGGGPVAGAPGTAPGAIPGTTVPGVTTPAGTTGGGYQLVPDGAGNLILVDPSGKNLGISFSADTPPDQITSQLASVYGINAGTPTVGTLTPGTTTPGGTVPAQPGNGTGAPSPPYAGFQSSPGYQFQFNQGLNAINSTASARGGVNSGNTLKALQQYGTGLANQDWYNYLAQLTGLSNVGENAAANLGNTAVSAGSNIGAAIQNAGQAQASGIVGSNNALQGGVNNFLSYANSGGFRDLFRGGGGGGPSYDGGNAVGGSYY